MVRVLQSILCLIYHYHHPIFLLLATLYNPCMLSQLDDFILLLFLLLLFNGHTKS